MTEPARILIIRLSSIGDIVLATPLVRQVRTRFPHATIDFLTKPAFAELLAHNSHLSHLFTTENFTSAYRYDLCIDLQNNWRSYRLRHRLASKTFVYRKQNWRKFLLVAFKWRWQLDTRPVPLRYLSACAPLGLVDDGKGCELFLSDAHRAFAQRSLAALPTLAVCYGAKHFTKRFPLEKLARVLNALQQAEPLLQVVLLGGREDAVLGQMLTQQLTPSPLVKNFSGQCSLLESAALIERADAVLTNDTGLMHIAAAFQKRLVVLFGSSVREFGFLPFRAPFELIENPVATCRPCSHIGRSHCPKGHFRCMKELDEQAIVAAVRRALGLGVPVA